MDEIRPTPRNQFLGLLADKLREGIDFATYKGQNKPMNFFADALSLNDIQKTADRLSYAGNLTTGGGLNTRLKPEVENSIIGLLPFAGTGKRVASELVSGLKELVPSASTRLANNMAERGVVSVGENKLANALKAPQTQALELAQQRAALPIEQGGLGLPANNTAMDRASAMGFDLDYNALHGTTAKTNFKKFKAGQDGELGQGIYFVNNDTIPSLYARGEGGKIIPSIIPKGEYFDKANKPDFKDLAERIVANDGMPPIAKGWQSVPLDDFSNFIRQSYQSYPNEWLKRAGYTGAESSGAQQIAGQKVVFNPDDIRSRFAAFDPWRRTAATAATFGVAAPDLLAQDEKNRLVNALKGKP